VDIELIHGLQKEDGNGIGFLTGGTAGDPDPDLLGLGASLMICLMTFSFRTSKYSLSRKKDVTPIRTSLARSLASSGLLLR
jgi:hypothetical protein